MNKIYGFKWGDVMMNNYLDLTNTFSLHIIPEGYTNFKDFSDDWQRIAKNLVEIKPFNLLNNQARFQIIPYLYETVDYFNNNGPKIISSLSDKPINQTLIDSYIHGNDFGYDSAKLLETINALNVKLHPSNGSAYDLCVKDTVLHEYNAPNFLVQNSVFIVLLNGNSAYWNTNRVEIHGSIGSNNEYDIYFTESKGFTEVFVARILGRHFGKLADEHIADNGGTITNLGEKSLASLFENLILIDGNLNDGSLYTPPNDFKWKRYLSKNQKLKIRKNATAADLIKQENRNVELWEGGLGYEHGVYRSAYDCIMKRPFNDSSTAIKDKTIVFCPICTKVLERRLTGTDFLPNFLNGVKTLSSQKLIFDEIKWKSLNKASFTKLPMALVPVPIILYK